MTLLLYRLFLYLKAKFKIAVVMEIRAGETSKSAYGLHASFF